MKILAIETSCDETAVTLLECSGNEQSAIFRILGNGLLSQIDIHREFGGVFPAVAKREHAKNLVPILSAVLEEAEMLHERNQDVSGSTYEELKTLLDREPELFTALVSFLEESEIPDIDAIAVTAGPGLVPALWVGVNFARALAKIWDKPLIAVNHMEGHFLSALTEKTDDEDVFLIRNTALPVLGLLISGGHTEIVVMKEWLSYQLVGATRDDAVGEAFDKVARMMQLPYPGGPEISRLSERARNENIKDETLILPRPMRNDGTCDFSFSGLKTAVMYLLKEKTNLTEEEKIHVAHEFENAVSDVLWHKTSKALEDTNAKTLVIGGGVSANTHIRRVFETNIKKEYPEVSLCIPSIEFTGDNAIMIGIAAYFRALRNEFVTEIKADGNRSITQE